MAKYCNKCGSQVEENQTYCTQCGNKIDSLNDNQTENHNQFNSNQNQGFNNYNQPNFENYGPTPLEAPGPINRGAIKNKAKFEFFSHWPMTVAICAICGVFTFVAQKAINSFLSFLLEGRYNLSIELAQEIYQSQLAANSMVDRTVVLVVIYSLLITLVSALVARIISSTLVFSQSEFIRHTYRGSKPSLENFTSKFGNFGRYTACTILIDLFVFLWTLVLIIPGIIKAYAYSMAPYLMAEFDGLKPIDAIKLSKRMTSGYKGELFILTLSFLGWGILGALLIFLPFGDILIIVYEALFLTPYMLISQAGFYEKIKANSIMSNVVSTDEITGRTPSR